MAVSHKQLTWHDGIKARYRLSSQKKKNSYITKIVRDGIFLYKNLVVFSFPLFYFFWVDILKNPYCSHKTSITKQRTKNPKAHLVDRPIHAPHSAFFVLLKMNFIIIIIIFTFFSRWVCWTIFFYVTKERLFM